MVKEKKLLTLEQAIHKACCQPLREIAKIGDRGVIREGCTLTSSSLTLTGCG